MKRGVMKEKVMEVLQKGTKMTRQEIADACGCSINYVDACVKEFREKRKCPKCGEPASKIGAMYCSMCGTPLISEKEKVMNGLERDLSTFVTYRLDIPKEDILAINAAIQYIEDAE